MGSTAWGLEWGRKRAFPTTQGRRSLHSRWGFPGGGVGAPKSSSAVVLAANHPAKDSLRQVCGV